MRYISVVMEEMLFKDISFLELWQPFCSAEQNHLCNFGRRSYEEQICEIILNLDQWLSRWHLKVSYLELWRPSCSVEQNHLYNFERGYHREHSCEVIWNLDQWFRRCRLKKKFTHDGWADAQRRRTKTDHNSSPWAFLITIAHLEPSAQVS